MLQFIKEARREWRRTSINNFVLNGTYLAQSYVAQPQQRHDDNFHTLSWHTGYFVNGGALILRIVYPLKRTE